MVGIYMGEALPPSKQKERDWEMVDVLNDDDSAMDTTGTVTAAAAVDYPAIQPFVAASDAAAAFNYPAIQPVVAVSANANAVDFPAIQPVVAAAANSNVVNYPAIQPVVAAAANSNVVDYPAIQPVVMEHPFIVDRDAANKAAAKALKASMRPIGQPGVPGASPDGKTASTATRNAPSSPEYKYPANTWDYTWEDFERLKREHPYHFRLTGDTYRQRQREHAALVKAMADLDVRTDDREERRDRGRNRHGGGGGGRGGGGGGGGDGNNKRRRDDEDDYHYSPHNDRRPHQRRRRGDDRHHDQPRRRFEEVPFAKLRRLMLNIASSTKLPQDEAIEIAEFLGAHFDDQETRSQFFDVFVQLIVDQPFKIPFAAAVAFYGNQVKSEIVIEAVKRVGDRLQEALSAGQWREFKLLLRFLACLQPVFEGEGIFAFLQQMFDAAVDLQSANENDVVGIELVKIILLTIPYAVVAGGSSFHERAQSMLESTGIVAGNVLPVEALIHPYDGTNPDVLEYHSVISLLQQQLVSESESGWELACIPRFDADALNRKRTDETLPPAPPSHAFPTITLSSPVNPGPKPLFPEAYFSLFANQDVATVPKTTEIAASLIRDAIVDTIDQLDFNRESVAKFLVDLDCYWSLDTFAKRGQPLDKFREVVGDKIVYKSEDMVIDAIFSLLFKLPTPDHKLVYYHSIITQCCKVAPAAIAPSLGRSIRTIYRTLPGMDLELAYRFLDWFTHHLSNFEFRWRWTEWVEDLELSNLHPKKALIIAALDKEIRLSFAKRVRATLPEPIHALIPQRLDDDNSPDFKYDNKDTPYATEGQTLLVQLRKKATHEAIQETIDKIHAQATELAVSDPLVPSTDAFVTAICRLGAKSLSHALSCIERGKERLLAIAAESEAARRQIVASVVAYWNDQPGVAVRIIDMLLNYTILAPMTVVTWVFDTYVGAGHALAESWVFEIVCNTVNKVANRNRQIASARCQSGLPPDQIAMVDATLARDRDNAREIYKYIEDATRGIAEGSADQLIEKESNGEVSTEEGELLRAWGRRWCAVFVRKAAVEESVVGEAAMEARIRLLAAEEEMERAKEIQKEQEMKLKQEQELKLQQEQELLDQDLLLDVDDSDMRGTDSGMRGNDFSMSGNGEVENLMD